VGFVIITDGSASNITGQGGYAAIVRNGSSLTEIVGHAEGTTSNRMEMMAAIEGLRSISQPSKIEVVTDSAYLCNTMRQKWYERWLEDEPFRTKPRPNMDLWVQLIGLSQFHDVTWIKVKGHSGDYWNERADKLADKSRREKLSGVYNTEQIDEGWNYSNPAPQPHARISA
jgi:ribonuclease HI